MKNASKHHRNARKPALSSIGLAAITSLLASGAYAAPPPEVVSPYQTVQSDVNNNANVSARIIEGSASIATTGGQNASANTLNTNTARANAVGNSSTSTLDLALIQKTGSVDGQAVINRLVNTGEISSEALGNQLSIDIAEAAGNTGISTSNTGNVVSASATSNSAFTSVAGAAPVGYDSTKAGASVLNNVAGINPVVTGATGSIVVTSEQLTTGASNAVVKSSFDGEGGQETYIQTHLHTVQTGTLQGSVAVSDNTFSSSLKGNSANSLASLQSGGANAFAGSAAVTNLQTYGALDVEGSPTLGTARTEQTYIGAVVAGQEGYTTLSGSMAVSGNTVSASATGNEALGNGAAGNRILMDGSVAFAGSASPLSNKLGFASNNQATANTGADLVILNSQANLGSGLTSSNGRNTIEGFAEGLASASLAVSNNSIAASTTGNAASSAMAMGGASSASLSGSAVIANQQSNQNAGINAANLFNAITAEAGTADDAGVASSAMTVSGNRMTATAYGNEGAQSLSLTANTVATGTLPGALTSGLTLATDINNVTTVTGATVSASGAATLTNLQRNLGTLVSATTGYSQISAEADTRGMAGNTLQSSSLAVTNNTQEAVAVGSGANNALALSGNSVGAGAGISSLQYGDATSNVSATLQGSGVGVIADTHVTDGSLALTGNLQRAVGYGNSVVNSLNVTANASSVSALDVEGAYVPTSSVTFANTGNGLGLAFSGENQPQVSAANGLLNNQVLQASVTASASALNPTGYPANTVLVEGNLTRSSAINNANAFIGAAYGNDAANTMALDLGNVSANTGVANAANVQTVAGGAITGVATGGTVVGTLIDDSITSSTVSTSSNVIQALAVGNHATSQVNAQANNVQGTFASNNNNNGFFGGGMTGAGSGFGFNDNEGNTSFAMASFSAQNAQAADGNILATQVAPSGDDEAPQTLGADIRMTVGNSETSGRLIKDSTLRADGNRSIASATANSAATGVSVTATNLAASSAVANLQASSAQVGAVIGQPGQAATPGTPAGEPVPFGVVANQSLSANFVGGAPAPVALVSTIYTEGLSTEQIANLTSNGWTNNGSTLSKSTPQGTLTPLQYATLLISTPTTTTVNGTTPGAAAVAGTPAIPNQGGVVLALRGAGLSVDGSTLSVSGNATTGSVTGNKATNSLSASAVNLDSGNDFAQSAVALAAPFSMLGGIAAADHALSNQQITSGALSSTVMGSFAIDATPGTAITNASLAVSGNSQSASVVANTAANSVALSGTNVAASSALLSQQSSSSSVEASSALMLFAPVASSGSSISLSDNQNRAQGMVNDVSNTLSVNGTNLASLSGNAPATISSFGLFGAFADHALVNLQTADTSAASTASTGLYNQDQLNPVNAGLVNGSVTVSGNATMASAIVNRASNLVEVGGAGVMSATAGLANVQLSSGPATASASTGTSLSLTAATTPGEGQNNPATSFAALNQSSVNMNGNSTTAVAYGNSAVNALNATAGSVYSSPATAAGTSADMGMGMVQATLAVLNLQQNSGTVTATSTAASYQVAALSPMGLAVASTGSAVNMTGNSIVAEAVGNNATNAMTVSALSGSAPTAALVNYQQNGGNVNATVRSVNYGVGISGGATNSALRVSGNQISATAIGNSAVSSIAAAAR